MSNDGIGRPAPTTQIVPGHFGLVKESPNVLVRAQKQPPMEGDRITRSVKGKSPA